MAATLSFPLYFSFGASKPSNADVDAMVAAGAQGVRCALQWDGGDPDHSGDFAASSFRDSWDAVIKHANGKTCLNGHAGFDIVLQVGLGPTFGGNGAPGSAGATPGQAYNHNANADGTPGNNGNVDVPVKLAQFMVAVGTRYAPGGSNGVITALELGNEPNHAKWDTGVWTLANGNTVTCSGVTDANKGKAYLETLARVYPPLHALGVTVISGGLGGIGNAPGDQAADSFLNTLLNATFTLGSTTYHGTDGLWDHFNFHPYCYWDTPTQDIAEHPHGRGWWLMVHSGNSPVSGLPSIKDLLNNAGLLGKGIWVTEFGQYTNGGAAGQDATAAAAAITDACNNWQGYSWGGGGGNPFCWFQYEDSGNSKDRDYGVVNVSGVAKQPLWNTIKALGSGTLPVTTPTITGLSVASGPPAGGTSVTITGTNFTGATSVKFGSTNAASFSVTNDTHINATSPAGSGTVRIKIIGPGGTSPDGNFDSFNYNAVTGSPTITNVTPTSGSSAGQDQVITITGTNFSDTVIPTGVNFGGVVSPFFAVQNSTTILAEAPAGSGTVNVSVTNGTSTSVANGTHSQYTYVQQQQGSLPLALGLTIPDFVSGTGAANLGARPVNSSNNVNTPFKRGVIYWSGFQNSNPGGDSAGKNDHIASWGQLNDMLDAAFNNGYKLIGCVSYSPDWAKSSMIGNDHTFPDRDEDNGYRDYANFCWMVADHCEARHPGVLILEIWNEPQNGFLDPISRPNYVSMLSTAFDAVKTGIINGRTPNRTAYPNVPVITGGTGAAPAVGSPNRHLNWCQYIITNAPTKFDHMTIHAYAGPDDDLGTHNGFDPGWNDIQGGNSGHGIRYYLDQAGRTDATIVSTEAGVFISNASGGGTLQDAATRLTNSWAWWKNHAQAYGLSVYCLYEQDDTGSDLFNVAGIYSKNASWTGPAKTNSSGVAVFLNAYNAIQGTLPINTAPTASVLYPSGTPTVNGVVTFVAESTDDNDRAVDLTVKLFKVGGTTAIATMSLVQGYGWYYNLDTTTGSYPNGTYNFVVKSTDSGGLTTSSSNFSIVVNNGTTTNNPPVVSWVTPLNGTILSGPVTFVLSATDDNDTTVAVNVLDGPDPNNADNLGTALVQGGGKYKLINFDTTTLLDGVHTLTGVATDSQSASAFSTSITVTIDNSETPPPPGTLDNCGSIGSGYIGEYAIGSVCAATVPSVGDNGNGGGGSDGGGGSGGGSGNTFQTGPCLDRLWLDLPAFYQIADVAQVPQYPLLTYTRGVMQGLCAVEQLFDRINYRSPLEYGQPGDTSDLVDPDKADPSWFPWLAQLVGIDNVKTFPTVDMQRTAIKTASTGWQAGSIPSIVSAVSSLLNGTRSVTVTPDYLGDPHQILVFTRESETPPGFATIQQAIENANVRPAGIKITVRILLGTTYRVLDTAYSGDTYDTLEGDFITYNDLEEYHP